MARLKKKQKAVKKVVKRAKASRNVSPARSQHQAQHPEVNMPSGEYIEAVGRRKVATARVRIYKGQTGFVVNHKESGDYFSTVPHAQKKLEKPFEVTGTKGDFGVTVQVSGSGISSQLDAVVHGLARALVSFDPSLRSQLKPEGLLTRDPRMKETRKIGTGGKARRKRQSPKR